MLVALGLVVGATALFVGLVVPFSGWAERVLIGLFGGLFLFALGKGFVHVRAGRVALHREWMIRAFAIALAIATQRVLFVPSLFVVGDPTYGQVVTISVAAWSAALVVHSSLAEAWIRLTRKRRVPETSGTEPPTVRHRAVGDEDGEGGTTVSHGSGATESKHSYKG